MFLNSRFRPAVSKEWTINRWLARHYSYLSLRALKALEDKLKRSQVNFGVHCFCMEGRIFQDDHRYPPTPR